jgi:ATP-binding cassette subfamily F protein 3
MPLITTIDLGKSYGPDDIFSNLSVSIPHHARIALVGANGIGKTTLLSILAGEEDPSNGVVQRARGIRLGYLSQESQVLRQHTLWEDCLEPFSGLIEQQAELAHLERLMSDPQQAADALAQYGAKQQDFERRSGYTYEARIRQTLTGLGFSPGDFKRPLSQLSGGQRTRALLARLLLSDADLLLLDEPTNHLDIEAVEWLETYLKEWNGAVLIVSHDRYFLDQVASAIWEMTPAIEVYRGNYTAYLSQRGERYARRMEEYQTQAAFIDKEEEYIRRNIAGQNTRQAQGRRKRLERLIEEARLTPPVEPRRLHLHLTPAARSGELVVRTCSLAVGYADEGRPLFRAPDLTLERGECAAVIGPNGAGKTTFLKTLLGQIPPYAGEVLLGASLKIGYFAQAHEGLHPEINLIEEINTVAPEMLAGKVREYLAKFLFTGDDVFKPVNVLSGGERGRLALAKLALSGANLLLLDEPTNHLDLPSQEVLQAVLADFSGTILLVSHDRYLIDALATQIWELDARHSQLRAFAGTYSEYRASRQAELAAQQAAMIPTRSELPRPRLRPNTAATPKIGVRSATPKIGVRSATNQERQRKQHLLSLEAEIASLEGQLAAISHQLENPPADPGKVMRLGQDYQRVQQSLDQRLEEWAQAAEEG